MREDPYYIVDDRPSKTASKDDIDGIPIVHLDDLPPPLPKGSYLILVAIKTYLLMFPSRTGATAVRVVVCSAYSTVVRRRQRR